MRDTNAPCRNCADRRVGCHGICSDYIAFQKECERIRENKYKQREYDRVNFRPDHTIKRNENTRRYY